MASLPVRLTRAASKLGMLRRGYADEAANAFSLTFATPAKVFCNESMVKQVDVPTFSGHLGVLREHVPTIAMLQPGLLVVHGETTTQKYFERLSPLRDENVLPWSFKRGATVLSPI